jgi:hypothetical protein
MRRVLQNSRARGTLVHCVGDEVAEDGADHGGVGDVGERPVACSAQLQQQLLKRQVNRTQAAAARRGEGYAVYIVAKSEGAHAHAMMAAFNARLFKRCNVIEELWKHQFGMIGLAVCENDNVDIPAVRVVHSQGKGELVGRDQVGGACGLQAVDNCLRLKFACAARHAAATAIKHLASAQTRLLASCGSSAAARLLRCRRK